MELLENFGVADVSETSSSSVSSSSTSLSDNVNKDIEHPSFLGNLLESVPSSIEQSGPHRLDSSCIYIHERHHADLDVRKDSTNESFFNNGSNYNDNSPPIIYDDIDFPSEDVRKQMHYPGIRDNVKATNIFLDMRHNNNLDNKLNTSRVVHEDIFETKDYESYLIANSASPNAIQASLLYCLQNDDLNLADALLRDVGIEYLLRHCYLMTMHNLDGVGICDVDYGNRSEDIHNVQEANIFWLACYYGSAQVLDIIAQDTLAYFLENETDHFGVIFDDAIVTEEMTTHGMETEMDTNLMRAKSMLTNILEKPMTASRNTPLYTASERDNGDVVKALLKCGVNPNTPNKFGNTPVLIASSLNNVQALHELAMSTVVDWNMENKKGMRPLLAASQCGNLEALKVLKTCSSVDLRAVDANGFSCTILAARYGQVDVVNYFAEIHSSSTTNGVNINQQDPDNETALHVAVRCQHYDIIRTLLKNTPCHCDVSLKNNDDMTALHLAARGNCPNAVREFVSCLASEKIALLDTKDRSGATPLHYAALNGFVDVVKLLAPMSNLGIMCQVRHRGIVYSNRTALAAAALSGHVHIIIILLQCGADINQTDENNYTTVSLASKHGQLKSVSALVANGADLHIRSRKSSRTPLQKARKYKQREVVEYLEMHGG